MVFLDQVLTLTSTNCNEKVLNIPSGSSSCKISSHGK